MKKKGVKRKKSVCIFLAILLLMGSFMGVDKLITKKRSITIVDDYAAVSKSVAVSENKENMNIKAKAAVLIDGYSGKILYEKNPYKHLPPASVTKVMTLLLIMEGCDSGRIKMSDKVVISERAASMGGSQMYMEAGEEHTVEELIKGVIMASANDGCVALAEYLSGSVEEFVEDMNEKAAELGLKNSHFINTNGLPVANHYSCAYDIGVISQELIKHKEIHKWFTAWQEDIMVGLPGKESKFTLTNTNKLIKNYNGAIGIKTGFTQDAGYCLSGAAQRGNTRMIGVVLGCKTSDIRFGEMTKLLDYGFANYETIKVAEKGQKIKMIEISKGNKEKINVVANEDIGVTVRKGEGKNIKKKIFVKSEVQAPVEKGEELGSIIILEGKDKVGEYKLVADSEVKKANPVEIYIRMMKKLA